MGLKRSARPGTYRGRTLGRKALMNPILRYALGHRSPSPPWNNAAPVREELFGVERLEQHAESLAAAQPVTKAPPAVVSLHARLKDNAAVLLAAYRATAAELESGRGVVPASEWLLDNYHLVEEQIREIRDDLPPGYYRQLPKLAEGPFAGYPRVFGLAWAFVAHTRQPLRSRHFAPLHCRLSAGSAPDDRRAVGRSDYAAHCSHREPAPAGGPDHGRTQRAWRCRRPGRPASSVGMRPLRTRNRHLDRAHPCPCPSSSPRNSPSG